MTIEYTTPANHVAMIRIARPGQMNSIDPATEAEIVQAWARIHKDDDIRCVVLTGSGERAFCAGADIGTMLPDLKRRISSGTDDGTFCGLTRTYPTRKPIIAAVNGIAFGGGLELALACDIRLASENARFALPEVKVGVLAGAGGVTRLPRQIPRALAAEMLLTGRAIDASEAKEAGLVSRIFSSVADLEAGAITMASEIAANAPLAVMKTLSLLRRANSLSFAEALAMERDAFAEIIVSQDAAEGIAAFSERRPPNFTGC